jgi:hypothetical protein
MATIHVPASLPASEAREFSVSIRAVLAGFSVAAGAIHLAMVGSHWEASAVDGVLFAAAGWFQLIMAFWLFSRPGRLPLIVNLVVNVGLIASWAVSRTVGLPWGAHAGTAEEVGRIDLLCVACEAALVVVTLAVLMRPQLAFRARGPAVAAAAGIPLLAVLGLTTAALASGEIAEHGGPGHSHGNLAGATGHAHGEEGGTNALAGLAAEGVCDTNANVASYYEELATLGTDHHAQGGGHGHGAEADTQTLTEFAASNGIDVDPELVDQLSGAIGGEPTLVVSSGEHGAGGPFVGLDGHGSAQHWTPMSDPDDCAALESELDAAREFGLDHPTVADAMASGYVRATGYIRGIAAHYIHLGYLSDGEFDPARPEMLLYDGDDPDSEMVGLSYAQFSNEVIQPAEYGFTGPNDYPHNHDGLCTRGAQVVGSESISAEECARRGGQQLGSALQMIHAWVIPGCESPYGVFSAENPVLDWPVGQHTTEAGATGCTFSDYQLDSTPGMPDSVLETALAAG